MQRLIGAGIALLLFGMDDPGAIALRELLPVEERIPDPSFSPEPGARLKLENADVPAAKTAESLGLLMKHVGAGDRVGVDRLLKGGSAMTLPKGTGLLVLESLRPKRSRPPLRAGLSGADVARHIQSDILNAAMDKNDYPVEARITDGPRKDQVVYVPESFLGQTKLRPPPSMFKHVISRKTSKFREFKRPALSDPPASREDKATAYLAEGQRLERRGEIADAVGAYWFTMLDFKDLAQAKEAALRLKRMGFSAGELGTYSLDPSRRSKQ